MIEIRIKGHNQDDMISTGRAAHILGLGANYPATLRAQRKGPKFSRLDGRHVAYRIGDIAEWLEGQFTNKHAAQA